MSNEIAIQRLGPYNIVEQLGFNGIALTLKGFHEDQQHPVAIVAVPQSQIASPAAWNQLTVQFNALATAAASRVCQPRQCGSESGYYWAAYEWLEGMNVSRKAQAEGLPYAYVSLEWMAQIVEALDTLARYSVPHLFLSPASVFITDIQHARLLHAAWGGFLLNIQGAAINPAFMSVLPFLAPEIVAGKPGGTASDVYSVGACLYYLLSGRPPHWADDPMSLADAIQTQRVDLSPLAPYVTPATMELVGELLARDPDDRPANLPALQSRLSMLAQEMIAALQAAEEAPPQEEADGNVRDHQNYTARGAAYEQFAQQSPGSSASVPAGAAPPPPVPGTGPAAHKSGDSVRLRQILAAAPAAGAGRWGGAAPAQQQPPPPPPTQPMPGDAADDPRTRRKRLLIMGAAGAVGLGLVGYLLASILFPKPEDPKPAKPAGGTNTSASAKPRRPAKLTPSDEELIGNYHTTMLRLERAGTLAERYFRKYGRYPRNAMEAKEVGATDRDLTDGWGTAFEFREGWVISAGKDKSFDTTEDDIAFQTSSRQFSGEEPSFDLEKGHPRYNQLLQIRAMMAGSSPVNAQTDDKGAFKEGAEGPGGGTPSDAGDAEPATTPEPELPSEALSGREADER
jgi:serine/threonine-protein kinase